MNRQEFRALVRPLTAWEEAARERWERRGGLGYMEADIMRDIWEKDADGYLVFSNDGMAWAAGREDDRLHAPLCRSELSRHLRLIIHHRFNAIPFHSTEFISVNYVYAGELAVNFPGAAEPLRLTAGQLIFMNAGIVHSLTIAREEDIVLGFQLERDFLNGQFLQGLSGGSAVADFLVRTMMGRATGFTYLVADFGADDRMKCLMEDVFCEYLAPGELSDRLAESYIRIFFLLLVRSQQRRVKLDTRADILAILGYVQEHAADCTLAALAARFHFHPKYLGNLIKKLSGHTFEELLLRARLERARDCLLHTDLPVAEIAARCGYTNLTFFYRKFRLACGCSPKEYREKNRRPAAPMI